MITVDLSHTLTAGITTYPGLPGPEISEHLSFDESRSHYDDGTEFCIRHVGMVSATGTYLDAPFHRYRNGDDVASVPLSRCACLPAVVVSVKKSNEIGSDLVPERIRGAAVLFHTGWDTHWGTPLYGSPAHPHLTEAAARVLVDRGAALVGIDSVNIDGTTTGTRPVHSTLLAAGTPIVENLTNLAAVPPDARFSAVPLAFEGMPSFPVRAYAYSGSTPGGPAQSS